MCAQHMLFLAYVSAYVSGGASYVFPYVFLWSANSFGDWHLDSFIGDFFQKSYTHIYICACTHVYAVYNYVSYMFSLLAKCVSVWCVCACLCMYECTCMCATHIYIQRERDIRWIQSLITLRPWGEVTICVFFRGGAVFWYTVQTRLVLTRDPVRICLFEIHIFVFFDLFQQ